MGKYTVTYGCVGTRVVAIILGLFQHDGLRLGVGTLALLR